MYSSCILFCFCIYITFKLFVLSYIFSLFSYFNSWIEAEDITLQEGMLPETDSDTVSRYLQHTKKSEHVEQEPRQKRNLEDSLLGLNNVNFEACPEVDGDIEISWGEVQTNNRYRSICVMYLVHCCCDRIHDYFSI